MSDRSLDLLTEAILERDQPRTADLFFQMVKREGRSLGDALSVVTKAEAPFVQVPSHINFRDGHITLVNNDHTILGLRASVNLAPFVPEAYRLLPLLQSVWYIPAGLDIWNQLLGRYPGRYATMKGMQVPPPAYGPAVWNQEQEPITPEGTAEEKLHEHLVATASGDARRSYGLFLGLASDPSMRPLLRDQLLFLGLIDLQDTIIGRKARNTGHKALRARAVADLADVIGWERATGVYYMGVPDMAIGPLYYSLYDAACVTMTNDFPDAGKQLKDTNVTPLTPAEVEEMVRLLFEASGETVWNQITAHLKNGTSIRSLGEAIQIGAAELILHGGEAVHRRPASFRLLQHRQLLAAAHGEPVPAAPALSHGQLRQRLRALQQALPLSGGRGAGPLRRRGALTRGPAHRARRGHHGPRCPAHHGRRRRLSRLGGRPPGLHEHGGPCRVQAPGRSPQPEDLPLRLRGVRAQLDSPAGPAPPRRGPAPRGVDEDAGGA